MSRMFDNYPQPENYIPDNRPKFYCPKKLEIMAGETASHSFEIPFNIDEVVLDYEVIYKLGAKVVLVKSKPMCTSIYEEESNKTIITDYLSSTDTLLFGNTFLNAEVQIRFTMKDLSIVYTEIYPVKLTNALDSNSGGVTPTPHIIAGIGYTED